MSGPRDLELATALYTELFKGNDSFEALGEEFLSKFIYLQGAVLAGRYTDLSNEPQIIEKIKEFSCFPLLAPYLESRRWTEEEITALKVSHRLKR